MKRIAAVVMALFLSALICGIVYAAEKEVNTSQQPQVMPKRAQVDTDGDGKPDRTEYYDSTGKITKVEADANGDGKPEETVIYENGKPVKSIRDKNGDGKPDVWIDY